MAKAWTMIRVSPATRAALEVVRQRLMAESSSRNLLSEVEVDRFGLSCDSVIAELIRRDLAHVARSRKSSERRKSSRKSKEDFQAAQPAAETTA